MSVKLVAFLIGPSDSIGAALVKTWKDNGYSVALGSRSISDKKEADLAVKVDVTDPKSITNAFASVTNDLGAPSIVVYNAAQLLPPHDDILAAETTESYESSVKVGTGVFHAAQAALTGFRTLSSSPRTFIVTGNGLPFVPASLGLFFNLGLQKKIAAHSIEQLYNTYTEKEGIRFHFAYLVADNGGPTEYPVFKQSGDAHAKAYWHLTSSEKPESWKYTFKLDGNKF